MTEIRPFASAPARTRIFGVGGAGIAIADRLVLDGYPAEPVIVMDADARALAGSVAGYSVQLGPESSRGLGTGGDPDLAFQAFEESVAEVDAAIADAEIVLLCCGLGGGVGSGAAPSIAARAKEQGAITFVFATLPFSFEGKRRMTDAEAGLASLRDSADAVFVFENNRMGELVEHTEGIREAFAATDRLLARAIEGMAGIVSTRGLLPVRPADLAALLREGDAPAMFGQGESASGNRAHESAALALRSPMLGKGDRLGKAAAALVHIAAGPDCTFEEIRIAAEQIVRHLPDEARVHIGVAGDPGLVQRLIVRVLAVEAPAAAGRKAPAVPARRPEPIVTAAPEPEAVPVGNGGTPGELDLGGTQPQPQAARKRQVRAVPVEPGEMPAPRREEAVQFSLPFENLSRGKFDKSEPTIVNGEDLDVPTFFRKNRPARRQR